MHPAGFDPSGQVKLKPLQQVIFPEEQNGLQPLELLEEDELELEEELEEMQLSNAGS